MVAEGRLKVVNQENIHNLYNIVLISTLKGKKYFCCRSCYFLSLPFWKVRIFQVLSTGRTGQYPRICVKPENGTERKFIEAQESDTKKQKK